MTQALTPEVARRLLGHRLTSLRETRNRSAETVARELGWSPTKMSRCENGSLQAQAVAAVAALADLYKVGARTRRDLLTLAGTAHQKTWWDQAAYEPISSRDRMFLGLEQGAHTIRIWAPLQVPALLQTEDYARHDITAAVVPQPPAATTRRLRLRRHRQDILGRHTCPPRLEVILGEPALLHPPGPVLAGQLDRLTAGHPALTLQVLPLAASAPVSTGPFTVLGFGGDHDDTALPDITVIEHLTGPHLIDGSDDTGQHVLAFAALSRAALSPADSAAFIKDTAARTQP
jgi:Domain of unknown function (DUF5753)/Helix-turn-helix domain